MAGDIELLMDLPTYLQTSVSTQRCEFLLLDTKCFERLFVKRHPRTVDLMKESLPVRLGCRFSPALFKSFPAVVRIMQLADRYNCQKHQQDAVRKHQQQQLQQQRQQQQLAASNNSINDSRSDPAKPHRPISEFYHSFVPQQGALVDIFGPGTVFHLIRQREVRKSARKHISTRRNKWATNFNLRAPPEHRLRR